MTRIILRNQGRGWELAVDGDYHPIPDGTLPDVERALESLGYTQEGGYVAFHIEKSYTKQEKDDNETYGI